VSTHPTPLKKFSGASVILHKYLTFEQMTLVDPNQDVASGIRISAVKYAPEIHMNVRKKTTAKTDTNEELCTTESLCSLTVERRSSADI
jgi:hypothetical protein